MRAFNKELSGRGVRSCLHFSLLLSSLLDTLHAAAGARTLSGQTTSSYTAFLYTRKMIFREEVAVTARRQ